MRNFLFGAALFLFFHAPAQTLFTYGKDSVSVQEFVKAYQKNNTGGNSKKAMKEYLDLYIASRLKIKEAQARGYDTLPQLVSDMNNLRAQILPLYEKDPETLNRLAEEAFERSQKDIHAAHIFISYTNKNGLPDTAAARLRAQEAHKQAQGNASFAAVAKQYSDDPSAQENGGDLGFVTVFSLPYELEHLLYTTAPGKISAVYQSKAGFHIFKNIAERPAAGRIKAAQILLAFPPDIKTNQKLQLKALADSLYDRLAKGDDFGKLAAGFSNDPVSAQANGAIPEFGVGQYEPIFEATVFNLKDGDISKPFQTAHGYHILKRISAVPVAKNKTEEILQSLKSRIESNDRMAFAKDVLVQKVRKNAGYKKLSFDEARLWAYTDSLFDSKTPAFPSGINSKTPLFTLGKDTTPVDGWISYAQVFRYKADGTGFKPYPQVWDEFVNATALEYYKNHLEEFNADFRSQMNEFREGNLFFEIMQHDIWGPSQSDTAALKAFYTSRKNKYTWNKSVNAVVFYTSDAKVAGLLSAQLKKDPSGWKELVNSMADKVTADSGRFERDQIPNGAKESLKKGIITTPVFNTSDNTASFAYVTEIYTKPAQRSFEEAKGLVINDYQAELEQKWMTRLKGKYPVVVNDTALASLMNTVSK